MLQLIVTLSIVFVAIPSIAFAFVLGDIMAGIDNLNANLAQLKTDVEAYIASKAGAPTDAQVQAAADAVAALDAEVKAAQ